MTQRFAIAVAAALVAFTIVILGAVGAYVALQGPAQRTAVAAARSSDNRTADAPQELPSQDQPQAPAQDTSTYQVSAEQAANIALSSAPGTSVVQQPRLVNFRGTPAYEVQLDRGFVYVDANSGQVLFNGAAFQRRGRRTGR